MTNTPTVCKDWREEWYEDCQSQDQNSSRKTSGYQSAVSHQCSAQYIPKTHFNVTVWTQTISPYSGCTSVEKHNVGNRVLDTPESLVVKVKYKIITNLM